MTATPIKNQSELLAGVIEAVTGDLVKRHEGKQAASKFLKISSTRCKVCFELPLVVMRRGLLAS
jgi:hypothetical protein